MTRTFFRQVCPAMIAFAFSGLYTIVDGFFIGRNLGDVGLAAINLAFPLAAIVQAVGTGLGMGGAVKLSYHRGRGEPERQRLYLGNTITALLGCSALAMVVLWLVSRPLLMLFGAQGAVLDAGVTYLRVILLGTVFQLCATGFAPLLRNYDASVLAMGAMVAGFVTNIVLDWLFVSVYQWGMAGAAGATIIGQAVTVIPCVWFLFRRVHGLKLSDFRLHGDTVRSIFQIGLSPFGLTVSPFIVIILINKSAAVYGGDVAVAAYAVISYIVAIVQLLLQGIGDGTQPLMSVYFGRQDRDAILFTRKLAFSFAAATAVLCAGALMLLQPLIAGFFGASAQAAPLIAQSLPIFIASFLFTAFCRTATSYFYATQKNSFAYLMVYGEPILLAVLLAFVFPRLLGLTGVWLSIPCTQCLLSTLGILLLLLERRQEKTVSA